RNGWAPKAWRGGRSHAMFRSAFLQLCLRAASPAAAGAPPPPPFKEGIRLLPFPFFLRRGLGICPRRRDTHKYFSPVEIFDKDTDALTFSTLGLICEDFDFSSYG